MWRSGVLVGHNYAALQELLAQEVRKPTDDEVILKDNGFGNPAAEEIAAVVADERAERYRKA